MVNYVFLSVYFYSVPNLRFTNNQLKDFKIVDICKLKQGNQYDLKQQFTEEKSDLKRFIRIIDYTQKTNDIRYVYSKGSENYVDCTDVVVVRYGASAGYVGRGINGIIANNLFTIRPINSALLNKSYLYHYLNAPVIQKQLNNTQSSGMPALNFQTINNLHILLPEYQEQRQIAVFLDKIDERIQTQIKIIDSYFSLSKAISNTLIGQSKGNTRLRECLNCYSSNTMESVIKQEDLGDYPVYGANGIIKKINNYEIEYPSIAIVKDGSGVGKMFKLSGKYSILSTLNYLTSKPGYDIDYIYYALKQKSLKKYVVGSGIPHIYFKDYEQEKIYIPQNELQQQNITSVLQSIDEEIGNEIKQLKNYELLKKYLLKNMFV